MKVDDIEERLTELFSGPLEEFVERRRELAAEAKSIDPELGRAVAAARKPTVTAWAVNRLRAGEPEIFAELVASGRSLRQAVVDGDPSRALEQRSRALAEALRAVEGHWSTGSGPSQSQRRRIGDTLQALSVGLEDDPEIAAGLAGRLTRDLEPPGLESLAGVSPGRRRRQPSGESGASVSASGKSTETGPEPSRPAPEERSRSKERRRIQRRLRRIGERRQRLEQDLEEAREKVLGLQEELEAARSRRSRLRSELDADTSEQRELEKELRDLR